MEKKTLLIWNQSAFSKTISKEKNWILIDNQEAIEAINFNNFSTIIILAELNWEGVNLSQMKGLRLSSVLNFKHPGIERQIIIVSKFSSKYLQTKFKQIYNKALTSSKLILTFDYFLENINNLNELNHHELVIEQAFKSLITILYDKHDYDSTPNELISNTIFELNKLLLDNKKTRKIHLRILNEKLIPFLSKIKWAMEKTISRKPNEEKSLFQEHIELKKKLILQLLQLINRLENRNTSLLSKFTKEQNIDLKKLTKSINRIIIDLESLNYLFSILIQPDQSIKLKMLDQLKK